jgi:putative oxidoreductase
MKMMTDDAGKLLLRLMVGGLLILHGFHKLVHGPAPGEISGMLAAHGLPGFLAWGVYLGELVGPVLILLGVYARIGGLLVLANMVVAILLSRGLHIFGLNEMGGLAIELEVFYGLSGLCVAMLGAGKFSAGGAGGKWN